MNASRRKSTEVNTSCGQTETQVFNLRLLAPPFARPGLKSFLKFGSTHTLPLSEFFNLRSKNKFSLLISIHFLNVSSENLMAHQDNFPLIDEFLYSL